MSYEEFMWNMHEKYHLLEQLELSEEEIERIEAKRAEQEEEWIMDQDQ